MVEEGREKWDREEKKEWEVEEKSRDNERGVRREVESVEGEETNQQE